MHLPRLLLFIASAMAFSDSYLFKRQLFTPQVTTAEGPTCDSAFGPGYQTCRNATSTVNRLCFNPDLGQICCVNSWACPSGSYCSSNNGCCPNGSDEAACAPITNNSTVPSSTNSPTIAYSSGKKTSPGAASTNSIEVANSAPSRLSQSIALLTALTVLGEIVTVL